MRLEVIRQHYKSYVEACAYLRANYTEVQARKAALRVRDEFREQAPHYIQELVSGIDRMIDFTDGEECADPETCGNHFVCSRCRLRRLRA